MSKTMIGQTINNQYLLTDVLGEGGMGIVFKAEDLNLNGRLCAIKLLKGQTTDPNEAKRFEAELQIISRLRSPHVVQVLNKGYFEGHRLFIVMELLEGEPLSTLIKRTGALGVKRAIQITRGVLAGLSEAHEYGVVHRDLKPANIFITRSRAGDEITKVLDFGIAKDTNRDDITGLTSASMIIGTPKYMAPEQFMKNDTDQRTDLYAVGLLLYQMLYGQPPYVAESSLIPDTLKTMPSEFKVGWLHLNAEPVPLDVFPPLWSLCDRLLQKEPDARPNSATEVIAELNEIAERLASASNPYGQSTPIPSPSGNIPQPQFNSGSYQQPSPINKQNQQPLSGPHQVAPSLINNQGMVNDDPSTTGIPVISEFSDPYKPKKKSSASLLWVGIAMLVLSLGTGGFLMKSKFMGTKRAELCFHRISVMPEGVYQISKKLLRKSDGTEVKSGQKQTLGKTNAKGSLLSILQLTCGEDWTITAKREGFKTATQVISGLNPNETKKHRLKAEVLESNSTKTTEAKDLKPKPELKNKLRSKAQVRKDRKLKRDSGKKSWRERKAANKKSWRERKAANKKKNSPSKTKEVIKKPPPSKKQEEKPPTDNSQNDQPILIF